MENIEKQLENLSEVKHLIEKSTKFISLSGLAGVFAGFFALLGAAIMYYKFGAFFAMRYSKYGIAYQEMLRGEAYREFIMFGIIVGVSVLVLAILSGVLLTINKAKRKALPIWDNTSKRLLLNLFVPLVAGGLFAAALIYHGLIFLVAPVTLIFYGLALINASKYTIHDVKYLGYIEVTLGILSSFFVGYGLFVWALGFGLMHMVYGILMYYKYEHSKSKA
jgi:hypothetical protein